ncbi:unnamed protein product [Echinostoma caproni]|uniref:Rna-directed dna polymerase from mobile element jockey-like n=1 Tax=Echinostoma caproni TaxID=27848 RepID=A0A183BCW3_9TREM|nr:unnamed protein product [Echinostoma caproni]
MSEFATTPSEVKQELQELKSSKAAGPDAVHPAILKPLADVLAKHIAKLFNQSLCAGELPTDWKVAEVVPKHKGGVGKTSTTTGQ